MKTGNRLLIAALAACLLAGCGESPDQRLAQAAKALAENRYSEARHAYLAVLQKEPDNRVALTALVRTYLAQGDALAANGVLERMEGAGIPPADANLLHAEVALLAGSFEAALQRVANARDARAWRIRAQAHLGLKRPELAEQDFSAGLAAGGARGRLLADYANFKLGRNDISAARKLVALALQEEPVDLTALLVHAALAGIDRDQGEALKRYEHAAKVYPESKEALLGQIGAMAEMGWLAQVRPLVIEARRKDPGDTDFLYLDARLAAADKDWERVRALLQPYETDLSRMPGANALYARAQMHLGQSELARLRLASQLLRDPGDRETRMLLGEAKLAVGDIAGALETLEPVADWSDARSDELALLAKARRAAAGG